MTNDRGIIVLSMFSRLYWFNARTKVIFSYRLDWFFFCYFVQCANYGVIVFWTEQHQSMVEIFSVMNLLKQQRRIISFNVYLWCRWKSLQRRLAFQHQPSCLQTVCFFNCLNFSCCCIWFYNNRTVWRFDCFVSRSILVWRLAIDKCYCNHFWISRLCKNFKLNWHLLQYRHFRNFSWNFELP